MECLGRVELQSSLRRLNDFVLGRTSYFGSHIATIHTYQSTKEIPCNHIHPIGSTWISCSTLLLQPWHSRPPCQQGHRQISNHGAYVMPFQWTAPGGDLPVWVTVAFVSGQGDEGSWISLSFELSDPALGPRETFLIGDIEDNKRGIGIAVIQRRKGPVPFCEFTGLCDWWRMQLEWKYQARRARRVCIAWNWIGWKAVRAHWCIWDRLMRSASQAQGEAMQLTQAYWVAAAWIAGKAVPGAVLARSIGYEDAHLGQQCPKFPSKSCNRPDQSPWSRKPLRARRDWGQTESSTRQSSGLVWLHIAIQMNELSPVRSLTSDCGFAEVIKFATLELHCNARFSHRCIAHKDHLPLQSARISCHREITFVWCWKWTCCPPTTSQKWRRLLGSTFALSERKSSIFGHVEDLAGHSRSNANETDSLAAKQCNCNRYY